MFESHAQIMLGELAGKGLHPRLDLGVRCLFQSSPSGGAKKLGLPVEEVKF